MTHGAWKNGWTRCHRPSTFNSPLTPRFVFGSTLGSLHDTYQSSPDNSVGLCVANEDLALTLAKSQHERRIGAVSAPRTSRSVPPECGNGRF